ncbi:alpha-keto acid decarboxylase family protein [Aspergillus saccharolyticus JOP 1030-1]|uniref:Pyruvate decarboxylase n=1 Tax=Aspergillus saccharolyticus JOP 1030-1 TaxID=1450539 RepID=A0A319ATA8_9EURO|nr:pyruvate decarboxylase [Aspergillus saccharolyticus JOP 1030-1]PYH49452.1 pyruvate decarboxylase [Aspergillus saccharolyticus JOP 1030-1]
MATPDSSTITLADYLFTRLQQLGVKSLFGVPGDYNLKLLDYVDPSGLHWVGTCNELNAAYAADGYARMAGMSAIITTFGVGELSAVNGIAGAYAERAPVVHIVGTPPRPAQESRSLVHHTFADGEYRRFAAMHAHVTVAQTNLNDPRTVPEQIDTVLQQALIHSRPVYIEVPDDMPGVLVSAANLTSPIRRPPAPTTKHESTVLSRIADRIYHAKQPLILVDGESRAMGILDEINTLLRKTAWPTFTTVSGKGLVDEHQPYVYGNYAGPLGNPDHKTYFDQADLILEFGSHPTDTNTLGFQTLPNPATSITFTDKAVRIGDETYRDFSPAIVTRLVQTLDFDRISQPANPPPKTVVPNESLPPTGRITQKHFYRRVNSLFQPGDVVLTETGTASYGGRDFTLPTGTRLFGAITWLSIGYMLPATLGAALAQRERNPDKPTRAVLFIGDGSLQMTVQELSTILVQKLDVVIFLINNDGYTIERAIHGRKQAYNDVARWRHSLAADFFGAAEGHGAKNSFQANTWAELDEVLQREEIQNGKGLRWVEVFMEKEDVEGLLKVIMEKQIAAETA